MVLNTWYSHGESLQLYFAKIGSIDIAILQCYDIITGLSMLESPHPS